MVRQGHHLVAQHLDKVISATVPDVASVLGQVLIVCLVHLRYLMNGDFPKHESLFIALAQGSKKASKRVSMYCKQART
jgi:hypothetical protein